MRLRTTLHTYNIEGLCNTLIWFLNDYIPRHHWLVPLLESKLMSCRHIKYVPFPVLGDSSLLLLQKRQTQNIRNVYRSNKLLQKSFNLKVLSNFAPFWFEAELCLPIQGNDCLFSVAFRLLQHDLKKVQSLSKNLNNKTFSYR